MNNQKECIDNVAQRLKDLEREISELEKIIDFAELEVKAEYQKQIKNLFLNVQNLQQEKESIEKASGYVWDDLKTGTELSWKVLDDFFERRNNINQKYSM